MNGSKKGTWCPAITELYRGQQFAGSQWWSDDYVPAAMKPTKSAQSGASESLIGDEHVAKY